ncbi:other/AgaK1 protein kinase [Coprinopsis marcescibilis]|uniref:Other/AgaK1 protein kinase n=1 Tax=Coprinopsis marcescibilis TaxID=230819 RepID=A0A5C3KJQ1_COPMA|nr:other/AgaK1 protein kinase [Coprinopsis marcescibilis]
MDIDTLPPEGLDTGEVYWRDRYDWFLEQGYRLRSRFKPDWSPSWLKNKSLSVGAEDYLSFKLPAFNDAITVKNDKHVVLKRIDERKYPREIDILQYFSRAEIAADPRNRCIPLLQVLQAPDDDGHRIAVMPILRQYDRPEFDSVGEVVDFIRQLLEGFVFLHENRVAHRDVRVENIMMDPSSFGFERFHFCRPEKTFDYKRRVEAQFTRTERQPKYVLIDFGFSTQFKPDEMPPFERPMPASDRSLPELENYYTPCDQFLVDVYYVGNMLRMDFIDGDPEDRVRKGLRRCEFLRPLVDAMIKKNPEDPITMIEAAKLFEKIVGDLSVWQLRSRPTPIRGNDYYATTSFDRFKKKMLHWRRKLRYMARGVPPIPHSFNHS